MSIQLTTVRNYKGSFPSSFANVVQTVQIERSQNNFINKHVFSCNNPLKYMYCLRIDYYTLLYTKVISLIGKKITLVNCSLCLVCQEFCLDSTKKDVHIVYACTNN